MKTRTRILWVAFFLAVALVPLVGSVVNGIYSLFHQPMPPGNLADLDAALATYQTVARDMERRPKTDRLALDALFADLRPIFADDATNPGGNGCPAYDAKRLAALETRFNELRPFFDRFEAVSAGGPVLQIDTAGYFRHDPDFKTARELVSWELAAAIVDFDQGQRDVALRRVTRVFEFSDGLVDTPTLLSVMVGVAIRERLSAPIAHLIPRFTADEIRRLSSQFRCAKDARESVIRASMVDTAALDAAAWKCQSSPSSSAEACEMLPPGIRKYLFLFPKSWVTNYLRREQYLHLSVATADIEAMESWLAAGATQPFQSPVLGDLENSYFLLVFYPDKTHLLNKASGEARRRDALVKALGLELKRRGTPEGTTWEIPFDEKTNLRRTPEYGCLVEVKPK
jgi:hypothetical protein